MNRSHCFTSRLHRSLACLLVLFVGCAPTAGNTPASGSGLKLANFRDKRPWIGEIAVKDAVSGGAASVDFLRQTLTDADPLARARAAEALRNLGPIAAPATDSLAGALNDTSGAVVREALSALEAIDTEESKAALSADRERSVGVYIAKLKSAEVSERASAVRRLYEVGPKAKHATRELLDALRDRDVTVRSNAELTLLKIGVRQSLIDEAISRKPSPDEVRAETLASAAKTPVAPAPAAPPQKVTPTASAPTPSPAQPRSGYLERNLEQQLIERAAEVTLGDLLRDPKSFHGRYVLLKRLRVASPPKTTQVRTAAGEIIKAVGVQDERGTRLYTDPNKNPCIVEIPERGNSDVRTLLQGGKSSYFFNGRAKIRPEGPVTIISFVTVERSE